ncbi:MAG: pyruvate:ferredoxin (flavodoxin) oxidoreductase [Candidatus Omnitrophica bacterium]|nr:pyruvate:ferredoxin (flavodoxin) oxidoreductase [Candidatus Omnitrophota bacterium]
MKRKMVPHDGNSAVAHVAHATNEVIAIYPITPSSAMGEIADAKSAKGEVNIWGTVPTVVEMQSEAGAAGAVHGSLTSGALTTTFTASQGLLLMVPNMYKISGELLPTVFHIAARSIACQALSIFGDHSDVMGVRSTGWGMFASGRIQEVMDFALIAQAATLKSRVPFLHFFEGFRISHEIQKIEELTFDDMRAMIDDELVKQHRARGMSPDNPVLRGTSQNPDVYFTGRETVNKYYAGCAAGVQEAMDKFAKITGRKYKLFDYLGDPKAQDIIVIIGSGGEVVQETVEYLNKQGAKLGAVKVRLYRPFDAKAFVQALPKNVNRIAVLDRTKEPGSLGEPLYEDVRTAIGEAMYEGWLKSKEYPVVVGGRYGLGSAEFTPAMVKAVFDNLKQNKPRNHFSIGIIDDVMNASLEFDSDFSAEPDDVYRAMFYGLGADGTVGANKNSIKIIADKTDNYTQGYFEYDSKKAGAVTVSHLRFGKKLIRSPYLITTANFLACHNFSFLEKFDMLKNVKEGGTFLLTSMYDKDEVWEKLPGSMQVQIINKKLKFYVIDAIKIAEELGLGARINTIMQTAFFKISKVIDENIAIDAIKDAIKKTYGKKGDKVVKMNVDAVDRALESIEEVEIPAKPSNPITDIKCVAVEESDAPEFVKEVTCKIIKREGASVKVSEMPVDGTWPTATTQYEKRNIAVNIPLWNPETCIQCGRCSLVCPHAAIRMKMYDAKYLDKAPEGFKSTAPKGKGAKEEMKFTLQVAPEDCTGCGTCVENCPVKAKEAIKMVPQAPIREREAKNYKFFLELPETDPKLFDRNTLKGCQFIKPLFEYSGACAGCGETAYVKLLTQLFGDRLMIANATGCSSIYGGNLPTTPYAKRADGRGPTWNNSLFEDTAELAYGMRLAVDKFNQYALELVEKIINDGGSLGELKALSGEIKSADQSTQENIELQRERIAKLKDTLKSVKSTQAKELLTVADYLVKKSVWGLGGDGWAYDIGYGGLDHVLASAKNVNILVLDTEVYSNTGGQASKSTPRAAVAKFAASGKPTAKKDLTLMMMSYGYIYVAKVAVGADPNQLVRAFVEAEAYDGPSIIIAYAHCIAHGIDMGCALLNDQKKAVASGHWPLFRFNPTLRLENKNPFVLDSKDPTIPFQEYAYGENRYRVLKKTNPKAAEELIKLAQEDVSTRFRLYKQLSQLDCK